MLERFYVSIDTKSLQEMSIIELAAFYEKHYRQDPLRKIYRSIAECDIPFTVGIPAAIVLEAVVRSNVRIAVRE